MPIKEDDELTVPASTPLPKLIVAYTVFFQVTSVTAIALLLWFIPTGKEATEMELPHIFVLTCSIMLFAGILGGSLAALKKQITLVTTDSYNPNMALSLYLTPIMSGTIGIVAFISLIIIAHLLHLNLSSKTPASWMFFTGRMPYITFALFAGFATDGLVGKLRAISQAMFTTRRKKVAKPKADDDDKGRGRR